MARQPKFGVGDKVRVDGEDGIGTIIETGQVSGATVYYMVLFPGDEDGVYLPEGELIAIRSAGSSPSAWLFEKDRLAPADQFAEFFTIRKLRTRLSDHLYSYLASRTVFRVYQFKPVLKMLTSPNQRLLIADEVGLGKTIEAGLIWNELDARASLDRVLVVCPSGLRRKWRRELERRFDREVPIMLRMADFDELLQRFERQGASSRFAAIVGLETLRSESALVRLREAGPSFDLVIVDEAHHMRNRGTYSYELGEFLSEAAEAMVFLTATPLNLGTSDLFNLMNLLAPEEFDSDAVFEQLLEPNEFINLALRALTSTSMDPAEVRATLTKVEGTSQSERFARNPVYADILERLDRGPEGHHEIVALQRDIDGLNTIGRVYTRTRKRDLAEKFAVRQAATLEVNWTDGEWSIYQAATTYATRRARRLRDSKVPLGFVTIMPQRQAASCLPVMRDYLLEAIDRRRPDADFEEGEEESAGEVGPALIDAEVAALQETMSLCEALGGTDTKFDRLSEELREIYQREPGAQVLLFSFFRRTLAYLHRRLLDEGYTAERMDGTTKRDERERLMDEFREGSFQILLSSEIGAEGLDFEFVRFLVNYDLPWNPMRLEQRIGRLDRFGQLHDKIVIVNFSIPGTVETEIFDRLYRRIGIFEASIGELEPILGDAMRELERTVVDPDLSPDQRAAEAERIALAVAARRVDLEQFEQTRARLIGQDDYVVEQLDEIASQKRYITPDEIERLFRGFLEREVGGRSTLRPSSETPGLYHVTLSARFSDLLRGHLLAMGPDGQSLVNQLDSGSGFTVTFDPEIAYKRRAEFINIRHPFLRAIMEHYAADEARVPRAGALQIETGAAGDYWFFVFMLEASGLLPQHRLFAVAVHADSGQVDGVASEAVLPGLAASALATPDPLPLADPAAIDRTYEVALSHAFAYRETLEGELTKTNEAIAFERIDTLRQSADLRTARLRPLIAGAANDRIRRMRESQLRNVQIRAEAKVEEIERKRRVVVSVKPIAGGFLRTV